MLPFSTSLDIKVSVEGKTQIDLARIVRKFADQFDNVDFISEDSISFEGFSTIFKRHGWLKYGTLKVLVNNSFVLTKLDLVFSKYYFFLIVFGSIWFVYISFHDIWTAIIGFILIWLFYALLISWTVIMFKATIKSTIKHQLFLIQSGL